MRVPRPVLGSVSPPEKAKKYWRARCSKKTGGGLIAASGCEKSCVNAVPVQINWRLVAAREVCGSESALLTCFVHCL